MRLYPAIDIKDGQCVRLKKGLFNEVTVYSDKPYEIAKSFEESGAQFIHTVDLDGALKGHGVNAETIKKIVSSVNIPVQMGGGIRTLENIKEVLDLGVYRVIIGTKAVEKPDFIRQAIEKFGPEHIVVGVDAKDGLVAIEGWEKVSDKTALSLALAMKDIGVQTIVYTDISKDGMLSGPNVEQTKLLSDKTGINIIASGGMSCVQDLKNINDAGIHGAIIGKAIYENRINLKDAVSMFESGASVAEAGRKMSTSLSFKDFKLNSDGLIPVVVQDYVNNEVLMVAYMNEEAYNMTVDTGIMTYYSRSRQELFEMSGDERAKTVELHRPYIDEITLKCPECGGEMHRVPEVIDCWFDSGAMPFAQHHYPFENQELFHKQFPAQFISEAVDQTRGWFYSLLAESTLLFNEPPYQNVIVLGHVQDENGQKMSKSKGNAVDPFDALEKYGADAIRWYFYINSAPWLPNRFHGKAVQEGQRKFMGTLWNTYAFFVLYANIDNFDATKYTLEYDKLPVMDKWILSKMNTMVKDVDYNLGNYRIPEAARVLQDFVDDLSNWYVRRSRERFWAKGMEQDKINAYMTLYTALVTVSKAAAPMIPFMTEEIYQNLVCSIDKDAPESIHLCDFPEVHEEQIDKELENNMEHVLDLVVMGRACRNASNIKNRQPIGKMFVKADFDLPEFYQEIVADELNVKNVKFTDDVRDFTSYSFKPQLKTVGPKYGKMLGGIKAALNDIDGNAAMDELNATGALKLDVNGQEIELFKEDLLIDTAQIEGYESVNDNGITVVLDTNLSPELLEEGFVREIISKIQTMRKEADFEVMDRIKVTYEGSEKAEAVFEKNNTLIAGEVLADEVVKAQPDGYVKEWKINGEAVTMGVEKKGE